jgi:tight adherence protein B
MSVILILFFVAMAMLFSGIAIYIYRRTSSPEAQIGKRVEEFSNISRQQSEGETPFIVRDQALSDIPALNRFLEKLSITKKIERLLMQANSKWTVGKLLLYSVALALLGFLLSLKINNYFLKAVFMAGLGSIPVLQVYIQKTNRLKAFIRAFPDSIDMMASAIRAGHAFNQAMQLVGNEAPDPVGSEFKRTYEQYNLGLNLKDVLMEMTERMDSLDLKLFVTAILLQKETGGNLTEILDKISYTIRERFKLIGQIKTYTAQGRMSAAILGTLPAAFVLVISGINPGYLTPLFHDPLGHNLIVIAVIMQLIGYSIIHRIVKIKYQ